jgi:hypothetical protein
MLYSRLPAFVLGFHGCDRQTANRVVGTGKHLRPSLNIYDWLGHGIYFWENDAVRARQWAQSKARRNKAVGRSFDPAVVGAVIDLGHCLNLLDVTSNHLLAGGYKLLADAQDKVGLPMPANVNLGDDTDLLLRHLDCAVINHLHDLIRTDGRQPFDSVRAAFIEGEPVYPGATFRRKNHIQVCVRSRTSIKGYFHVLPQVKV